MQVCEEFVSAIYRYIDGRYVSLEGRRWLLMGLVAAYAHDNLSRVDLFVGGLGTWFERRGDMSTALTYHLQALAASRILKDKRGEASIFNNLGLMWDFLGSWKKALQFYEKAFPLINEVEAYHLEAITRESIALILWDHRQQTAAMKHLQFARELRARIGIETKDMDSIINLWKKQLGGIE